MPAIIRRPVVEFSRKAGVDPDPWQADVLASTESRLLICCSRQSGKSTTVATLALWTAFTKPGSLSLLVSPGLRQSGELFKKAEAAYLNLGKPIPPESETALTLTLENGSRIVSLPGKDGTVRGYSGVDLLVIDEAAWVPNNLYVAVRPMLAVSQGRLVVMSTPFGTRGWFYDAWRHGGDAWRRFKVTADQCPRIAAAFLAEEEESLGSFWYRQEYFCEFLDAQNQAFTAAEIERGFEEEVSPWALSSRSA